ncbi:MAG TPA: hypothetical protein VMU38_01280 [Candidatus Binatia bacterium]|nr:hypothetical protein [Candidatus Binatia bacterium]
MRVAFFNLALLVAAVAACDARESAASALHVPAGFVLQRIADIDGARELAALPNGDVIVGTRGSDVYIVADAEGAAPRPIRIATLDDDRASGVAFAADRNEIYVGTTHHVWVIPYRGDRTSSQPRAIADVRGGSVAPGTDGDEHLTTSVAYADGMLYVSAGSSCNATMDGGDQPCAEVDPTRAAISVMRPDGSGSTLRARRIRNAVALAVNPQTHAVWIGDAGQDGLPFGHPYEFLDDLSAHPAVADYGWPECEENRHAYWGGADCAKTVAPLVELPAYSTILGAAFYPAHPTGTYAFPQEYRGGLFATAHGSWHRTRVGCYAAQPRLVFVPMNGDRPTKAVNWNDPTTQWTDFVSGFQGGCTFRTGRPTGIAIGSQGSLFFSDDAAGGVYRVRPLRS